MASTSDRRVVLIAMDGSAHSDYAFYWYAEHLHQEGDVLVVAYFPEHHSVTFGTVNLMTGDPDVISRIAGEENDHTKAVIRDLENKIDAAGIRGKVVQVAGSNAGEAVIQAAEEHCAQLIVTGSRGHGVLRRTVLGSVSDFVLHHSDVPVMICKKEDHDN